MSFHWLAPDNRSVRIFGTSVYQGWLVVAACFIITMTLGQAFWSFGVFFKPLQQEFGWSRTTVSSAYTFFLIGNALSLIAIGRLLDRYDPRPFLLAGAMLIGLSGALSAIAHDIDQLRIYSFIAGAGAAPAWAVPGSVVQRWFTRRRHAGLALGIVSAGIGVGGLIFVPTTNHLILSFGWRHTYQIMAIVSFVFIAAATISVNINLASPRDKEAEPRSCRQTEAIPAGSGTRRRELTSLAFMAATFALMTSVFSNQVVNVHLVPLATDVNVSPTTAAGALGIMGVFYVPALFVAGPLSEAIGWQRTFALALLGMSVSIAWLVLLKSAWMLYVFVILYGMTNGIRIPASVGIFGEMFGLRSIGVLVSVSSAMGTLFAAGAPYVAGFVFDRTESYVAAIILTAALLATGALTLLFVRRGIGQQSTAPDLP